MFFEKQPNIISFWVKLHALYLYITSGLSYKPSTIIMYKSRVINMSKLSVSTAVEL